MTSRVENVLFDIGGVLLHIEYLRAVRKVLPKCDAAKCLNFDRIFTLVGRDPVIAEYETGRIDTAGFFERFRELTGYRGTIGEFSDAWQSILSENGPMLNFAREISDRFETFLATNTSELLSIQWLREHFPAIDFLRDAAASYELGVMKPDPEFYRKAAARFGVRPETCLFIDDRPENVAGAAEFGFTAVRYRNATSCIREVRERLSV